VLPRCAMKIRDLINLVERDGWQQVRVKGDHRHYHHPIKRGIVTIAGHAGDDIKAGTLNSVLKQAGLK
jgi:predicted RNA binding protein YcfA (HicA-like mRNA interferase family)